jgi:hypothetical protein
MTDDRPGRTTRLRTALAVSASFIVALLVRLQSLGKGILGGTDSFYHLRRAELAAAGRLESFDAWTNYPFGQVIHWPRLYAEILGRTLEAGGETALLILPIVFGLATLAALALWARPLLGSWVPAALMAAAVSPALSFPTTAGAIDHHGLEGFLAAAVLGAAGRGGRKELIAACLLLAFGLLTVPTAPILLLPVIVILAIRRWPPLAGYLFSGAFIITTIAMIPLSERLFLGDPWIIHARETKPLFASWRDLARAVVTLGPGLLLLPLAVTLWWRRRGGRRPSRALGDLRHPVAAEDTRSCSAGGAREGALRRRGEGVAAAALAATATFLPMALFAERFVAFLAIPCVLSLAESARWFATRRGRGKAIALLGLTLMPMIRGSLEIRELEPAPSSSVAEAIRFLREETPPAGDPLQPEECPAYGVVSSWDLGHQVLALGLRPAVANAFHHGRAGRELARTILFLDHIEGSRIADRHGIRYLLLTDLHPLESWRRPGDPPMATSLFGRLYLLADQSLGWRCVFTSHETFTFEDKERPAVQVWERHLLNLAQMSNK